MIDRLTDGNQCGQGIAHHGQAQPTEELVRQGCQFERQLRDVTPPVASLAELSGDRFYAHVDEEAARRNPLFRGQVAHGYLVLAAAAGLFVDPAPGPVLANYGIDSLRFLKPVRPGDRVRVRLACKEKSLRAASGYGEVRWDAEILNQDDERVAAYDVLTMVALADDAPGSP